MEIFYNTEKQHIFKYNERNIKTGHFYGFGLRISLWNQCLDGNAIWKIQNILRSKGFVIQNSDILRKRKNEVCHCTCLSSGNEIK